jgi:outer membrane receptor for ferrienterochelin and colicins
MKIFLLISVLLFSSAFPQKNLNGNVSAKQSNGSLQPLNGANIYWLGTSSGSTSDENGNFSILYPENGGSLLISMIGYKTDTLFITSSIFLEVVLVSTAFELRDVNVTGTTSAIQLNYLGIENKSHIKEAELFKAACCNLSESFETNPSVDVSFTDAITGAKQIEMLGLSGIYTQTTMENMPYIRGLMSTVGLTFIPGVWIKQINMAKGVGSVVNGFESITGQIDLDIQKPEDDTERLLLNLYGDNDRRMEGNLNYRMHFGEKISAITLFHSSRRNYSYDGNSDRFTDMPDFSIYNIMQRWNFHTENGWEGQLGFQYFNDTKEGGTIGHSFNPYNYNIKNKLFNLYGKTGYVFPGEGHTSAGIQWSYNNFSNNSVFGRKVYTGNEKTGYINLIFESVLGSDMHKYKTGISFLFDEYDEIFSGLNYARLEKIPGAFLEYTFTPSEIFAVNLGFRGDYHNFYGKMFTPRMHIRYAPHEDFIIRAVAGKGYRTSNILTEHPAVLASSRTINISRLNDFGYGLGQESAWNYGLIFTYYFLYDYREATLSLDVYSTQFQLVTIADLDTDPRQIHFSSLKSGAYSNSLQVELNIKPLEGLDFRGAYRFMDVKQKY